MTPQFGAYLTIVTYDHKTFEVQATGTEGAFEYLPDTKSFVNALVIIRRLLSGNIILVKSSYFRDFYRREMRNRDRADNVWRHDIEMNDTREIEILLLIFCSAQDS